MASKQHTCFLNYKKVESALVALSVYVDQLANIAYIFLNLDITTIFCSSLLCSYYSSVANIQGWHLFH